MLNRFQNMYRVDGFFSFEVGYGAGYFENSMAGPAGEAQLKRCEIKRLGGLVREGAKLFNLAGRHTGIAAYFVTRRRALKTPPLYFHCRENPPGYFSAAFLPSPSRRENSGRTEGDPQLDTV